MKMQTIEAAEAVNASVRVERAPLAAALAFLCSRVIERRYTVPILSNVAMGVSDGGGLSLFGTDLDLQAEFDLPAEWAAPGHWTVNAHALRDIVKKAEGDTVTLTFDGRLSVESGRNRSQLATLPLDDFPVIAAPAPDIAFALPGDQLARDLAAIAPAMSSEETRFYLNGAALQVCEGQLALIATDGSQLAHIFRPVPEGADALPDVILPSKAVAALLTALKKADASPLSVEMGGGKATFTLPGLRLTSMLIDGTFPDWQAAIAPALGAELQHLAIPELEPRLNQKGLAALAKAVGPLSVETGELAARLSCPDRPEWLGLSMFNRSEESSGRYHYEPDPTANRQALEYVEGLRERYGLPSMETKRLVQRDGRALGVTYGEQHWQNAEYEERPCYETFTIKRVQVQEGGLVYENGAYSVFIPRADRPVTASLSVEVDGVTHPLRVGASGLELSKEAVHALCGPVDDMPRVEIEPRQFLHGEVVAYNGVTPDGRRYVEPVGLTYRTPSSRRSKLKTCRMTDRQALDHYCADPARTLAMVQPTFVEPVAVAEETARSPEAPEPAAERVEAPAAICEAPEPVEALSGPESSDTAVVKRSVTTSPVVDHERAAGDTQNEALEMIRALEARIAALEAAASPASVESIPVSMESELPRSSAAAPSSSSTNRGVNSAENRQFIPSSSAAAAKSNRTPAHERLLRRYLAMRRQRELDRTALEAAAEFVREADAERDRARAERVQPVHSDQEPGYPAIARMHEERAAAVMREADLKRRFDEAVRRAAVLADEVEALAGRAIRAERALIAYRTPEVRLLPAPDAAMEMEAVR